MQLELDATSGSLDLGTKEAPSRVPPTPGLLKLCEPTTGTLGEVHRPHSGQIVLRNSIRDQ